MKDCKNIPDPPYFLSIRLSSAPVRSAWIHQFMTFTSCIFADFLWNALESLSLNKTICFSGSKWIRLWSVGIWLMGGKAHHAHFPFSLLQFFCSPPSPTTTTLTSCFLPGLTATKWSKNKLLDFSWAQFCHHCSDIGCLFAQLNLAISVKASQWVRAYWILRNSKMKEMRLMRYFMPNRVAKLGLKTSQVISQHS